MVQPRTSTDSSSDGGSGAHNIVNSPIETARTIKPHPLPMQQTILHQLQTFLMSTTTVSSPLTCKIVVPYAIHHTAVGFCCFVILCRTTVVFVDVCVCDVIWWVLLRLMCWFGLGLGYD